MSNRAFPMPATADGDAVSRCQMVGREGSVRLGACFCGDIRTNLVLLFCIGLMSVLDVMIERRVLVTLVVRLVKRTTLVT